MSNEKKKARNGTREAGDKDRPAADELTDEELDQASGGGTTMTAIALAESNGWTKEHSRKSGAIVVADFNYEER